MAKQEIIFGLHAVQSLLKASPQRIQEVWIVRGRQDARVQKVLSAAQAAGIKVLPQDKKSMDSVSADGNHQGVLAYAKEGQSYTENDLYPLIEAIEGDPLIVVLDGVTDPHNLGACLRSADAAGAHALIVPKDNSVGLTEVARKVACGAADNVPLIVVTNLARCLKKMQEQGLWVAGTTGDTDKSIYDVDLTGPRVIVMGAEGTGMRRLTTETCDDLVKIPMLGSVTSLNVSVATGVVLFEVVRQRQAK
ncbi:23S rRNA (guanosine(2251)-2'-O)-methyltransferase RlmB [Saccharophagus degradans]|uniref:23S rRNA (guanosine(2251)-2'-O)-methyltransferase RlmB n=1 Tax=Saccharophagus degradans TaxID=86304 RepID=UPI0024780958|nr:23S rRNA (guanosine(2251)-2'-O)-methyltransferase RlmB [Saccharophagus degradans]WGO97507.1 23S rRNA (guanosine(2251)-2'-O)-methyltransferase RlmB [Saccharophagus degradans]